MKKSAMKKCKSFGLLVDEIYVKQNTSKFTQVFCILSATLYFVLSLSIFMIRYTRTLTTEINFSIKLKQTSVISYSKII